MAQAPYQQTGPYIPRSDSGFRDWLLNASTLISANPARFGLVLSDATTIAGLYTSYNAVYALCQSAATRTTGLVTQKDVIKAQAVAAMRVYAMRIKADPAVTDQDKVELGIHVDDPTHSPIPVPTTMPLLTIQSVSSGEHVLRYSDELTPASRKKPAGAKQLELYLHLGTTTTADWQQATYVGVYTKNPVRYSFTPDDAGLTATYFARWRTAKGLAGPFSLGVSMMVAFGSGAAVDSATAPQGGTPLSADGSGGDGELKIAA